MALTRGIDVSEHQQTVDWDRVKASGLVDFAVLRSDYGLFHHDRFFERNKAEAERVGIPWTSYAWLRVSQDVTQQADRLAEAAAGSPLPPWVDFERQPGEGPNTVDGLPPESALGKLDRTLNELHARDGRLPTVYSGVFFWRSLPGHADPKWAKYGLAVASYGVAQPQALEPWGAGGWSFWQYSSSGRVPGIDGSADLDYDRVPLLVPNPPVEAPVPLNAPVVAVVAHPSGDGYWEIASDGGEFNYGAAPFIDTKGLPGQYLAAPIVDAACTPSGNGLWLVAADGGVFAYGDAPFKGSAVDEPLNAPVRSIAPTPTGQGYWLAAGDGGLFAYGDAPFHGHAG